MKQKPSSLRRSTRITQSTLGSSEIKRHGKGSGSLDKTRKKVKSGNGATVLKKLHSDIVQAEKERMDARGYAQLFIPQKKRNDAADPTEQLKQQDELSQPDCARGTIKAANDLQSTGVLDPVSIDRSSDGIDLAGNDNITNFKAKENVEAIDFDSSELAGRDPAEQLKPQDRLSPPDCSRGTIKIANDLQTTGVLDHGEQLKQQDELSEPSGTIKADNDLQTTGALYPGLNDRSSDDVDLVGSDNITPSKIKYNVEDMDIDSSELAGRENICILNLSQHEVEHDMFIERCIICFKMPRFDFTSSEPDLYCSCEEILDKGICNVSAPKDNPGEHLNIPCLLENGPTTSPDTELKASDIDEISLPPHIMDEGKSDLSRFSEYWVPVQISDVQIEQYCDILYSNAMLLRTCTNKNLVGALREILSSMRKCCDHPYLLDSSLEPSMIKDLPPTEYLDVGIKMSGKLQLLDKMLLEIKNQNLKVLILYQAIGGYGKDSTGNYLDDFLHRKFGPDSYERVDACMLVPSKKQATLDRFNNGTDRFVFLLENRACHPGVKLLSVDCIIIFDSDWNPVNDIRSLQKISINFKSEKIKLFRLYSSSTVEEKVLILAKQGANLDGGLHNISNNSIHMLLMWGALYLSNICDKLHNGKSDPCFHSATPSLQPALVTDVIQEITTILLQDIEKKDACKSFKILGVQRNEGGSYVGNGLLLNEMELQHSMQETPQVFWAKLLEGKKPRRECFSDASLRNRKRVHLNETSVESPSDESNGSPKKCKKVTCKNIGTKSGVEEGTVVVQGIAAYHRFLPFPESADCAHTDSIPTSHTRISEFSSKVDGHLDKSKELRKICDAQKNLHLRLMSEILELCKILDLKENAKSVVERLVQYILDQHHVDTESTSTLHAFQLALCWVTVDLMKHDIDKKDSLAIAKQHLKFTCEQEEVECIYSMLMKKVKMRKELKKLGSNGSYNTCGSPSSPNFVIEDAVRDPIGKNITPIDPAPKIRMTEQEQLGINDQAEKYPGNHADSLLHKQYEEVAELLRTYEEEKTRLKTEYQVELAVLSSIHPSRIDKLKTAEETYEKKLKEHSLQMGMRLQNLKEKLLALSSEDMSRAPMLKGNTWPKLDSQGTVHWNESTEVGEYLHTNAGVPDHSCDYVAPRHSHLSEENSISCDVPIFPDSGVVISHREHCGKSPVKFPFLQPVPDGLNERESVQRIELDYSDVFTTERIFKNRDELIAWTKEIGRRYNMTIIISKSCNGSKGKRPRLTLGCGRHGKKGAGEDQNFIGSCGCPFKLRGHKLSSNDEWTLKVECGVHNHEVDNYLEGRYSRQLTTEQQAELACQLQNEWSQLPSTSRPRLDDLPPNGKDNSSQKDEIIQLDPIDDIPGNHEEPVLAPLVNYNLQAPIIVPAMQSDQEALLNECDVLTQPSSCTSASPATLNPNAEVQIPVSGCAASFVPSAPDQSTNEATGVEPVRTIQSSASTNMPPPPGMCRPDLSSTRSIDCRTSSEGRGCPPDTHNTVEHLNQGSLRPETNISLDLPMEGLIRTPLSGPRTMPVVSGLSNRSIQTASTTPSMASQVPRTRCLDPLQNETERVLKETEEAIKTHEETKLQLKSNCEKEIEEFVAQIRGKYDTMLGDANTQFSIKKQELDAKLNKLHHNKMLAEAFKLNVMLSAKEGLMLNLVQPSSPTPSHPIASPSTVTVSGVDQHIVAPPESPHPIICSVSPPVSGMQPNFPGGQLSATFPKSRLSFSPPTRPLHISNITPPVRNVQFGSEVRSRAPHLRAFRPSLTSPLNSPLFRPQGGSRNQPALNFPPNSASTPSLPSVLPQLPPSPCGPHQPG